MITLSRNFRRIIPTVELESLFQSRCYISENDQIKRPPSPFGLFLKDKHAELKRDNPNMAPTDIMKLASNLWKSQSRSNQEMFRSQFEEQLRQYKSTQKDVPKRPATAFVQFFKENNASLTSSYPDVKDRVKRCSELWSELSDDNKQKYRDSFQSQFQEYLENLTEDDKREIELRKEARKKRRAKSKKVTE